MKPRMHCQQELERDLGYPEFLPDSTMLSWSRDRYSTSKHLLTLYSVVIGLQAKRVLEIGFGRSSFVLAKAVKETGGQLTCCDTADFSYLLSAGERQVTTFIHGTSAEVWQKASEGIDFAFLDYFSAEALGADFIAAELEQCFSKMRTNGLIAIHDSVDARYSIRQAMSRYQSDLRIEFSTLPYNYGLTVIRYKAQSAYGIIEDGWKKKEESETKNETRIQTDLGSLSALTTAQMPSIPPVMSPPAVTFNPVQTPFATNVQVQASSSATASSVDDAISFPLSAQLQGIDFVFFLGIPEASFIRDSAQHLKCPHIVIADATLCSAAEFASFEQSVQGFAEVVTLRGELPGDFHSLFQKVIAAHPGVRAAVIVRGMDMRSLAVSSIPQVVLTKDLSAAVPAPHKQGAARTSLELLYLCDRTTFLTKMSRVRFQSMEAIGKQSSLTWFGPGWDGYDASLTVQENIDRLYRGKRGPDMVIAYKPLNLREFKNVRAPKCIRYNEMYDVEATTSEILQSGVEFVVCHHKNDMLHYQRLFAAKGLNHVRFVNIPHCAEQTIYKDYHLPKEYDLLLVGAYGHRSMLGPHYPLRDRFAALLPRLAERYRVKIHSHPGYDLGDAHTNRNAIHYAQELNKAKICLTCSGKPRSRFGKYVEIPMCASAIAADFPDEDHEFFKQFVIQIELDWPDEKILSTLSYYLENDAERERKIQRGLELSRPFNQEYYASRFIELAEAHLSGAGESRIALG